MERILHLLPIFLLTFMQISTTTHATDSSNVDPGQDANFQGNPYEVVNVPALISKERANQYCTSIGLKLMTIGSDGFVHVDYVEEGRGFTYMIYWLEHDCVYVGSNQQFIATTRGTREFQIVNGEQRYSTLAEGPQSHAIYRYPLLTGYQWWKGGCVYTSHFMCDPVVESTIQDVQTDEFGEFIVASE